MWADINGERKKVACGPCIRGHRSSKCDHRDRVLVEVRKPGRPLSSCPHPSGSCSCERVVINYTIPKTSECACPSERAQPAVASTNARVQKSRNRKSTSNINPGVLEKAIKANQDAETDASSLVTGTPTSESNEASAPSSASSTPHMQPSRKSSQCLDLLISATSITESRPTTSQGKTTSSCCQPKPVKPQAASCCSAKEPPKPVEPEKSCCSGCAPTQTPQPQFPHHGTMPLPGHHLANFPQYSGPFQQTSFNMPSHGHNFMPMAPPFNFNTPIYNHMASVYQPSMSMPMTPIASHAGTHATEHNCHCGDSCSCFGCAAHPNNATMIEYIRSMHQYMSTGQFGTVPPPTYDLPAYPHQAGFGAEANLAYNPGSPANFLSTGQMSFQANINTALSMPHTPLPMSSPWPHTDSMQQPPAQVALANAQQFYGLSHTAAPTQVQQEPTVSLKTEDSIRSPTFAESPSDGVPEETETLSPSSYFWQEMVLPGCNDATGTCQCGDGCTCVGCLTHGGHDGVHLNNSASTEVESFQDFITPTDAIGNESNRFSSFADSPT